MYKKINGIRVYTKARWADADSGTAFYVINKKDLPGDMVIAELPARIGLEKFYGGPGAFFTRTPYVKENSRKILIEQGFGFDV